MIFHTHTITKQKLGYKSELRLKFKYRLYINFKINGSILKFNVRNYYLYYSVNKCQKKSTVVFLGKNKVYYNVPQT